MVASMKKREYDKTHNKNRTKEHNYSSLLEMMENDENLIIIEANKRRTNITINEGVLRLIENSFENKSGLIEECLIKILEEKLNKKIKITKYKGNMEKY